MVSTDFVDNYNHILLTHLKSRFSRSLKFQHANQPKARKAQISGFIESSLKA